MSTIQVNRHRSFLDSSLRLDGITAILNSTNGELSYYSEIFIKSNIKFKKSFIKYLAFCKKQGFVVGIPAINLKRSRGENHKVVYYVITDSGKKFLELVS